ncbi:hypothetical protein DXK93_01585 [Achromobacter sp. K91]|uniref:hypothetical protein n=1 Tax=Achromobacter TaxID=222 RepID=UPI000972DECF|nr:MULTISPECIES: hypothetical protein [Achromobacter]APX75092.1 hypothetical protein BUW96_09525 [Achromobacter insolitus]OWT58744.1 hypothetical protein CEY08_18755 [Achromobacter insolitus]RIJ06046.1 hypothetical protein DXK93_01585 [Achromobacter sp. K91]CAB3716346.1 hypothetical protein LMG6003_03517 [Achromobacter insolitus]VEG67742.1 Uncharacterised protein [Achromobacter insolitus]
MSEIQRIPWVRERLDQWGRWVLLGTARLGGSVLAQLADAVGGGAKRSYVPVDSLECEITDRAVAGLPKELKDAVLVWHTSEGTMEGIAQEIGISKITLQRRLAHADKRIDEWFSRRRDLARRASVTL